ncbi:MAG: reverse transcriptase-like protein [Candidatus Zixiibacteriota bacterium]
MRCYFCGYGLRNGDGLSGDCITSFAIPDLGVLFRTRRKGARFECEYLALLTLLEFLSVNSTTVGNQKFEILSDSAVVVYQLTKKMPVSSRLMPYYRRVTKYRNELNFDISWIPQSVNRAAQPVPALPPLKVKFNFNFALAKRDIEQPSNSDFPTISGEP